LIVLKHFVNGRIALVTSGPPALHGLAVIDCQYTLLARLERHHVRGERVIVLFHKRRGSRTDNCTSTGGGTAGGTAGGNAGGTPGGTAGPGAGNGVAGASARDGARLAIGSSSATVGLRRRAT